MELKLLGRIQNLGYNGELTDINKLKEALKQGPKSPAFTKLVAWLTDEIAILNDMDESVHAITSADDSSSFLLELSCFLKELGCVNERLMTGNVNARLANEQDRYILLDFLGAELKACRLLESKKQKSSSSMTVDIGESDTAKDLKDMLIAISFEKPPPDITSEKLFSRLINKLTEVLKNAPPKLVSQPILTKEFSEEDWKILEEIQQESHDEYRMRRDMLLKRLDVTMKSFLWSDRVKPQEPEINKRYEETRKLLTSEPNVTLADLLAAREDIALMEKTSNATVRKNIRSDIYKVIIGAVPDRGGRPYEQEPPPPEMPPWQKDRVPGPPTSGGGRGGRGGGGGGSSSRGGCGRGGNQSSNVTYSSDNRGGSFGGNSGFQTSNFSSNSGGYGKQVSGYSGGKGGGYGGGQGGGYEGGQGGKYGGGGQGGGYGGGGQGGGYGGGQGGGYGGGQGGGYEGRQGGGYGGRQGGGYGGRQGGGYGGGQGGGYGGGQGGGYGGGQGGGYEEKQGGGYGGGQSGVYGAGNNGYNSDSRGYGNQYNSSSNTGSTSYSDFKGGQQHQRGGSRGGGRVQGGWNQDSNNYQRSGYNRGGGRGRQY